MLCCFKVFSRCVSVMYLYTLALPGCRRNGSRKKGSPQKDNQKVGGERIKDAMPSSQLNQLDGGTKDIWERHVPHPDASDMPELTLDCTYYDIAMSSSLDSLCCQYFYALFLFLVKTINCLAYEFFSEP